MMINSNDDDKLKKNERTLDPNCVILHYYIVIFRLFQRKIFNKLYYFNDRFTAYISSLYHLNFVVCCCCLYLYFASSG